MLARIHEEMRESVSHLDDITRAKVICAYVDYQLHGNVPNPEDVLVYSIFMAKKFDLDNIKGDIKSSIENGKRGGRPAKNFENSQKPKHNLNQPKDNLTEPKHNLRESEQEQEQDKEINNKKIFEDFRKLFPHARPGKKKECVGYFNKLDSEQVIRETLHLKRKIKSGIQDGQYVPACQRWLRDFVSTSEEIWNKDLEKIMRWNLTTEGTKERYPELVELYGEEKLKLLAKKISSTLDFNKQKDVQI